MIPVPHSNCRQKLPKKISDTIIMVCKNYAYDAEELINILHELQLEFGYLPESIQRFLAIQLDIPVSKIYGVITFYSFFTMKPKGQYPISICLGTACYVCGATPLLEEFERLLGIHVGETTPDGKFSLDCLRCIGACGLAPVVTIGNKIYGKLQIQDVKKILDELR